MRIKNEGNKKRKKKLKVIIKDKANSWFQRVMMSVLTYKNNDFNNTKKKKISFLVFYKWHTHKNWYKGNVWKTCVGYFMEKQKRELMMKI